MITQNKALTIKERAALNTMARALESLARMLRLLSNATEHNEGVYRRCVASSLPAGWQAMKALESEYGNENASDAPRFDNDTYTEAAVKAGGCLVIVSAKDEPVEPIVQARQIVNTTNHVLGLQAALTDYDKYQSLINNAASEGRTVDRNITYPRDDARSRIVRVLARSAETEKTS